MLLLHGYWSRRLKAKQGANLIRRPLSASEDQKPSNDGGHDSLGRAIISSLGAQGWQGSIPRNRGERVGTEGDDLSPNAKSSVPI